MRAVSGGTYRVPLWHAVGWASLSYCVACSPRSHLGVPDACEIGDRGDYSVSDASRTLGSHRPSTTLAVSRRAVLYTNSS